MRVEDLRRYITNTEKMVVPEKVATTTMGGAFAWGVSPSIPVLLVVLTPLCFAISIQNTVSQSVLSKTVGPTEIGGAFGLSSAVQNVGSIAAPIIGGRNHRQLGYVGAWGVDGHHMLGAGSIRLEQVREAGRALLGSASTGRE